MKLKEIAAGLFAGIMFVSPVSAAEWSTKVDEDVFSGKKTAVLIGGVLSELSVYLSCNADRQTRVALIFKGPSEGVSEGLKGEIVVKIDEQEAIRFEAESYQHNEKYGGFATELDAVQAKQLLDELKVSKRRILTGLQVSTIDLKVSSTLGASGSTTAANLFAKACEL